MKKSAFLLAGLGLVGVLASCAGNGTSSSSSGSYNPTVTSTLPTYTVTLNLCGGSNIAVTSYSVRSGESYSAPGVNPYREGYSFSEWCAEYDEQTEMGKEGTGVSFPLTITGNTVLYARYISTSGAEHTQEEVEAYMEGLSESSLDNHLYLHYYRYGNEPSAYDDWDVWAWPYKPEAAEGHKFDFVGKENGGQAEVDEFGGAYIDIDLSATYGSGWDDGLKQFLDIPMSFEGSTQVGMQIVKSSTRTGSSFWTNDGSNFFLTLEDYALELASGGTAYHAFVIQDQVQTSLSATPATSASSPFEDDDGTNVTYGDSRYDNVDWDAPHKQMDTAPSWKNVGVGYQIMVSSFADSDGDGFGDIYGIEQKLDYLEDLGVKALWLTPIQLSDSYHGYDISDYTAVDPKFGSSKSPSALANGGVVTQDSAMADYLSLIENAHSRGMKVVMDLVLNHTSTGNKWFISSANLDPDYRGYYQWGNHQTDAADINQDNYWYPYGDHAYSYYAKFGSGMPELNYSFQSTRDAVIAMSKQWCEKGVDGFRLDAVKHIYMEDEVSSTAGDTIVRDISASGNYSSDLTKNLDFFDELNEAIKSEYPDCFFVGENFDGHAYHVAPYYEAFDSMFDFYSYYNLTSAAATGLTNSTNAFGTASGFLKNGGTYTIASDSSSDKGIVNGSDRIFSKADGSEWNFVSVYNAYNEYRGDDSLPGTFTSNHDIARVINRVAGSGDSSGIQAQGNVNSSNYARYLDSSNLVKIAELMFPGLTWIYYGDEIGLTGNLPDGKDGESDYADLYYRQPMKWRQGQEVGDGSLSTEYAVTGSGQTVQLDSFNASTSVASAEEQMEDPGSTYSALKEFIALKTSIPALCTGDMAARDYASGNLAANVLSFSRTEGDTTIKVAINFNASAISCYGLEGTVLATYNGATQTSLPALSAIVVRG